MCDHKWTEKKPVINVPWSVFECACGATMHLGIKDEATGDTLGMIFETGGTRYSSPE